MIEKKIRRFELTPVETLDLIGGWLHESGKIATVPLAKIKYVDMVGGGLIIEVEVEVEG